MIPRLARFVPFAKVGVLLVAWVAAINVSLMALDKTVALSWLPDRSSGVGFLLESRQRVQSAAAAYRSGAVARDRPLAAIVGISDVREGVRLDTMRRVTQDRWRFVGVAGAGAGISSVEEQANLLFDSDLRPDIVVIGISPLQLIEADDFERAVHVAKAEQGDWVGEWRTKIRKALWLVQRRSDLNGWLDRMLMDVKSFISKPFGTDASIDTRSPWRPLLRTLGKEHYPVSFLHQSLRDIETLGVRKTATFEKSVRPFATAGTMARRFHAQGARVVVVIMPRHPWFEALLPQSLDKLIASRLRVSSSNPSLMVLDYSEVIPAIGFIDLVHLNTSGGEAFSEKLAQDLLKLSFQFGPHISHRADGATHTFP